MVNSLRPTSTRSPTRRASAKHPTPPSSKLSSTSPHPLSDHNEAVESPSQSDRPAKRLKLTLKGPKLAAVPADVGDTNATIPSPRPPVKLTLSEPHGPLLQTTNGVRKSLSVTEDSIPANTSPSATPASTLNPLQRQTRKTSERRSLRSHDEGPRLKSELAVYFPNYEDIIYDSNKEPDFITTDTIIHISDEPYDPARDPNFKSDPIVSNSKNQRASISPRKAPPSPKQRNKYNGAQVIDFSSIEKSVGHHPKDPLTDAFYFKSHRRAERKEKQLRNIEKERAMHEKAQLERLLEALQGHDWLRIMGIVSVADADAKNSKRDDDEEEDESESEVSSADLDASAAHQLQIEASGGVKGAKDTCPSTSSSCPNSLSRANTRRHGRTLTAFGVAIPEVEERDFALPEDYVTPEALRDNARKRRRMKHCRLSCHAMYMCRSDRVTGERLGGGSREAEHRPPSPSPKLVSLSRRQRRLRARFGPSI
ncbi:hypothetical protein KCV07_g154, partial [Aureobasidium melanogenum]